MAAQVDHDPGDIPEEGDGDGGADEGQQWLHYSKANDIISTLGSITWRVLTENTPLFTDFNRKCPVISTF